MTEPTDWKYSTVSPKPNRLEMYEVGVPAGHRLGYRRRFSKSRKLSHWQPYCTCKHWRSPHWYKSRNAACLREWQQQHVVTLSAQGELLTLD